MNKEQIKTLLIKILAKSIRGLIKLKNQLPALFRFLKKPAKSTRRLFLFVVVLPIYKSYSLLKKIATKFYAPQHSRHLLVHLSGRRYIIHILIAVVTLSVIAINMNAYEVRGESFGQANLIASLSDKQDLGQVEEEGPITDSRSISRYMGQTGVAVKPQTDTSSLEPSTSAGTGALIGRIISPAEEQIRQRDEIIVYTVQGGDTISGVAEKFGISVNTILWENNLTAYSVIRPGDKLTILPATGVRYKVARGDTLASIAKKYSGDVQKIIDANVLASADDIRIGETLFIPDGKKPVTQPVYTVRTVASTPAPTKPSSPVISTGSMTWPGACKRITQYYSWRHTGLDIACPINSSIFAADGGKVIRASWGGWNGGYGNVLIIDHGNGKQTLYGHLNKFYVDLGDTVEKGQLIAAEGSTGRSTGPHLHFEVRVGGVRVNPLSYIQ
ncbi:MAG: M23 family metallopeptidase [Candidatus Buchananbacteria bacterium]|nr:M23 family metallopeptidase [Candidatus Buchananbacteria bacterium]